MHVAYMCQSQSLNPSHSLPPWFLYTCLSISALQIRSFIPFSKGFSGDSAVKTLPANACLMLEMHIQSLGWEDPLEKDMATHSSILAWEMPWTEEPSGLQSMGPQRVGHNLATEQQQHAIF